MVAFKRETTCGDAEPYYYEFLQDSDPSVIPERVVDHIRTCGHCREEVRRLKEVLAESEAAGGSSDRDEGLIAALGLHFTHLGEQVSCTQVKPFLPALLQDGPEIRVPTPITVHVDHCARCAEDIRTLASLNLDAGQLTRLSRVLGLVPPLDSALCRQVKRRLADLACGSVEGLAPEILDHVSVCPRCRARIYRRREEIIESLRGASSGADCSACDRVGTAEIFDCVVPYGRVPGVGPNGVSAHLRQCPDCLEKVQALHRVLYGIAERADSETATVYVAREGVGQADAAGADCCGDYPINVRVLRRKRRWLPGGSKIGAKVRAALKRGVARPSVRPFAKAAVLMAALVPLALVMVVHTQSASGTSPEDIAAALGKAANVHIRMFHRGSAEPMQELWGSRTLDCLMLVTPGKECELYDMRAEKRMRLDLRTGIAHSTELHAREMEQAWKFLERYLGFTLASIPAEHQWRQVAHNDGEAIDRYELAWQAEATDGSPYLAKWQVAIDSGTNLPRWNCLLRKYSPDAEWECQSRYEFEYPAEGAIHAVVETAFAAEVGRSVIRD